MESGQKKTEGEKRWWDDWEEMKRKKKRGEEGGVQTCQYTWASAV